MRATLISLAGGTLILLFSIPALFNPALSVGLRVWHLSLIVGVVALFAWRGWKGTLLPRSRPR